MVNYVIDFVCQMSFIVMMLMFVQKNNVKSFMLKEFISLTNFPQIHPP